MRGGRQHSRMELFDPVLLIVGGPKHTLGVRPGVRFLLIKRYFYATPNLLELNNLSV